MCSSDANKRMKHHKINLMIQIFSLILFLSKLWVILIEYTCEGRYCERNMVKCWRCDDSRLNMTSSARICALWSAHLRASARFELWIVQPSLSSTRIHCSDIWERSNDWGKFACLNNSTTNFLRFLFGHGRTFCIIPLDTKCLSELIRNSMVLFIFYNSI